MKVTYFGHSALQIETKQTTILIDPFIREMNCVLFRQMKCLRM